MRFRFHAVAKRLALLLAVVLVGDRTLACMLAKVVSRTGTRFARAYRGGLEADVLVIGDSRGVNGLYGPAIRDVTGLSAFNLAYNGLSMHLCEALFLDYLEHNRAPRLLIVEASNVRSPDEMLDSLRLLGRSRYVYLDAIIDYNRGQFQLWVALGRPPANALARPVPADLVPPPVFEVRPGPRVLPIPQFVPVPRSLPAPIPVKP